MASHRQLNALKIQCTWFIRQRCWQVTSGVIGSAFSLGFGDKLPLKSPYKERSAVGTAAEGAVLVWCTWRLDRRGRPWASSDEKKRTIAKKLRVLRGSRVKSFKFRGPAWDLTLEFSGRLVLHVFCDHVPGEPSLDGNWQIHVGNTMVADKPGGRLVVSKSAYYEAHPLRNRADSASQRRLAGTISRRLTERRN